MKINNGRYPSRFSKELGHESAREGEKAEEERKKEGKEWTWVRLELRASRRRHSESNLLDARANRRNRAFTEGTERKGTEEGGGGGGERDGGEKETGKNEKLQQVEVGFYA